jgi:lipid II:glycine glycyltransferase (peptidoglycan interpeptide bridge formation enzyme)
MRIEIITSREIWENFIQSQTEYTFLQSWNWGEFSATMGHKIFRLGIFENNELIGAALVVRIKAKRGTFLFVPHGPILIQNSKWNKSVANDGKIQNYNKKVKILINYLKDIANEERCSFIRISSLLERSEKNWQMFRDLGFRKAPIHMHAESTLLLDITKSEEELLANMRKTTRYLIKRMGKEGVEINTENPPLGDAFLKLQEKVAERKHFIVFSKKQIKNEIKIFNTDAQLEIFNAAYNGKVIASALIIFYGYRAFYYQSASYTKNKNISAPYLLVWRAIQEAKKRNCKLFDFYGASPADKPNHPWAGPTLFKLGFGSERVNYLPAQDLILNPRYWITYFIEVIRRVKRGF